MIQIRPVSDLRNKFPDVEKAVACGEPVYLTKNGYGAMVVLSLEAYSRLTDGVLKQFSMWLINLQRKMIKDIRMKKFSLILEGG